ncbi:MAG: nucleoside hydrolase [Saprospiraceae bacterium]|nr:nucleoside hydrolase [Saprospiraceae bacterium]
MRLWLSIFLFCTLCSIACQEKSNSDPQAEAANDRLPVIFDTDANNELDDQHALAYLLFNQAFFDIRAITTNATPSGGAIALHMEEARRIIALCDQEKSVHLVEGADQNFDDIRALMDEADYDGRPAVAKIIEEAHLQEGKLVVIAVGKLTNVALAVAKDSSIVDKVRLVWLGSNYPEPGEYNQDSDTAALTYLLGENIPFELVTVRYGKPNGTDAVTVLQSEIEQKMPGLGPEITKPIEGRHGGLFTTFGDYAVDLFKHIDYYSDPPKRALFDLAAVAIVKEPGWAQKIEISAPRLVHNQWVDTQSKRKIIVWEYFNKHRILEDFYATLASAR